MIFFNRQIIADWRVNHNSSANLPTRPAYNPIFGRVAQKIVKNNYRHVLKMGAAYIMLRHNNQSNTDPNKVIDLRMKKPKMSRGRLSPSDINSLYWLDEMLERERQLEQRYDLPFRAPHKVLTSLQQCDHCGRDIALLIFGDNATDVAGLEAYARMMADQVKFKLPTYVITPPADPSSLENPSLLLKIYPSQELPVWIIPDEWLALIEAMSDEHCTPVKTRKRKAT